MNGRTLCERSACGTIFRCDAQDARGVDGCCAVSAPPGWTREDGLEDSSTSLNKFIFVVAATHSHRVAFRPGHVFLPCCNHTLKSLVWTFPVPLQIRGGWPRQFCSRPRRGALGPGVLHTAHHVGSSCFGRRGGSCAAQFLRPGAACAILQAIANHFTGCLL